MARWWILLAGAAAAWLAAEGAMGDNLKQPLKEPRSELVTHRVKREKLSLDVYLRGTLEAAENHDVICQLKAGPRGATLLWVIEDGSPVKKGQLLAKIDDSFLQEQLRAQKIVLEQARAAAALAEEFVKIVAGQNQSDAEAARAAVEIAELRLKEYLEGTYPQLSKDVSSRKQVAEAELQARREDANAAERLLKQGTITPEEARTRRLNLLIAQAGLERVKEEQRVLEQLTFPRMRKDLETGVEEVKQTRKRLGDQAKAKSAQTEADRAAKLATLKQEEARFKEIEEEIHKCQIVAPRDGMVIYHVPEPGRFGPGSQQALLAAGEPVREGQRLMRIPDLSRMAVSVRVPEAVITRVRAGQKALVQIDAFPNREFRGQVRQVSSVPLPADWLSAGEKTYLVQVTLEGETEGLKPGMSAAVVLITGKETEEVLAVPVQALLPPTAAGQRLCVVRTPDGLHQREVRLGQTNGKMTEVRSGLKEGEEAVLNPRSLYVEPLQRRSR